MEVRPEPGILSGGDSFSISIQPPSLSPVAQNMRMAFSGEGMAAYMPVSGGSAPASYQGVGGELPAAQGLVVNLGQQVKRKRGRPKKYAPDGTVAIGLSSAPASSPAAAGAVAGSSTGFSLSYTSLGASTLSPESSSLQVEQMKKSKGRPPGSNKKHQMNDLGSCGIGFTPHVIMVKAGEDVSAKIMSFSHNGPRAVCILSANGAISNVTLRQAATSGGTVTYEDRFEILSLSGSFLLSESAGQRSRTGGLSVSLAGPDGRVLGGGVAGLLTAASPVQVVVGSFIADGERKEQEQINPLDVSTAPGKLAPGGTPGPSSPLSRGYLSESSGGGPNSPFNQSINGNNNQQSLPNMSWK